MANDISGPVSGREVNSGRRNEKSSAKADITNRRFGRLTALYATQRRDGKGCCPVLQNYRLSYRKPNRAGGSVIQDVFCRPPSKRAASFI